MAARLDESNSGCAILHVAYLLKDFINVLWLGRPQLCIKLIGKAKRGGLDLIAA